MPKMPRQPRQISSKPPPRRAPQKKGSRLWILVIVIPLALVFFMGIVAAIAIPNLLTAIQRSKVARTRADMQAIGSALGSFQVDNNTFPVEEDWVVLSDEILPETYYAGTYQDAWDNWFFTPQMARITTLSAMAKICAKGRQVLSLTTILSTPTASL